MKKLFLMLASIIVSVNVSFAEGLITPPTENVTVKHYSLGAWFDNDDDIDWKGGYYVTMVWSNDGKDVWISNLFQDMFMDGMAESTYTGMCCWVHGTVDGNKINFAKEKIFHYVPTESSKSEYDLYLGGVSITSQGVETLLNSFNMVIDANGNIKLEDPSLYVCCMELEENGDPVVGDQGISTEDYVIGHEFTLLDESQLTYPTIPASVDMQSFTYKTTLYSVGDCEKVCTLGFDGNDVYVKGMCAVSGVTEEYAFPDVVFKGTLAADGKSFSLPSEQFYGIYDFLGIYYITFMYGAEYKSSGSQVYVDRCDEVVFGKDGDSWRVSSDKNIARASLDDTLYALESDISLTPCDPAAIEQVQNDSKASDGVMFNLLGQKVGNNAKGVIVSNGKKILK